jgi:hypothetical protein
MFEEKVCVCVCVCVCMCACEEAGKGEIDAMCLCLSVCMLYVVASRRMVMISCLHLHSLRGHIIYLYIQP